MRSFFATLLLLSACCTPRASDSGVETVAVELLGASIQCGAESARPRVEWIDSASRLAEVTSRGIALRQASAIDFAVDGAVLIEMGERPTAGYALALERPDATLDDGLLTMRVRWREPAADAVTAQILTSPCLVLRVPRRAVARIQVIDQDGRVRASSGSGAS